MLTFLDSSFGFSLSIKKEKSNALEKDASLQFRGLLGFFFQKFLLRIVFKN